MLKKILATKVALASIAFTFGQTESDSTKKSAFIISGSADVYFRHDFNKQITNNRTSFTNTNNSFTLGMLSVKAERSIGKLDFVADIGLGKRAQEFSYNDSGTMAAIKQLYISYSPIAALKITAGTFATHMCYEVPDAYANNNYSMSYIFSYGPFFSTGIKAEMNIGKKSTLMIGVANPSDYKIANCSGKSFIAQFTTLLFNDNIKLYLNYNASRANDSTQNDQGEVILNYTGLKNWTIGFDGTMAFVNHKMEESKWASSGKWFGNALYTNYTFTSLFSLAWRNEIFSDKNSITSAGINGNVFASTLSGNIKIKALTIIPECRFEKADNNAFLNAAGNPTKSDASFLIAAIYKF
ncbi:outer membrane beta-barrel protein [Chitinophagaceae bacterium LWZ2-11]